MPELRLTLLGPVRMWRDGAAVPLGSPQQRAVLAVLLLHQGRAVPADDLVDALWGENPPRSAGGTLRTYVSRLRQVLAGSAVTIETADDGYAVHTPPDVVDTALFETLVARARDHVAAGDRRAASTVLSQALALWSGEGLDGVPGEYAARHRSRWQAARLAAVELRYSTMLDAGSDISDEEDVAADLALLVHQHPYREQLRELLMRTLYRRGRQAEALAVYRAGESLLREELGIDPGPALQAVHQRILVSDPALLTPPRHISIATGGPAPVLLPPRIPQFTGRQAELARIETALAPPTDGSVTTVGVHGLDGLGRSALVVEAAHRAVGPFPGGRLYADLAHASGDLTEILGAWLVAYGVPTADVPTSVSACAIRLRAAAGERRVLAVLDGVEDTTVLSRLVGALPPGSAVLFVARRRQPEPASATWVHVGPLPDDDGLRLLTQITGPERLAREPDVVAGLVSISCGWPLTLRLMGGRLNAHPHWSVATVTDQLVRELTTPLGILHDDCLLAEAPVLRAFERLRPAQARALLRTAALDGDTFSLSQAAEVLDATCEDAWSVLDPLVELGLLDEDGSGGLLHSTTYRMGGVVRAFARRRSAEEGAPDVVPARLGGTVLSVVR
ncbi:BTAD domain-containing putative transcriptional regulator [Promicromonospora thailandica]|uniref:DNA-binding transcriptional activator of the SARP family n=1 Tax=Promicromonospora thailandica TaxID=765201 RepID=A0A9X2G300_9MICO|nr:BTAD domain-containing putative transcriptional regulator [Promicromonospora thailandica]MCP2264402.1 DNA-binding transcriptional activator of the SARP family [Promicromonospora thailandica]BFF20903.1 hypothetical protein GCM10025730_44240 [Promicromonospora thailandica]